jgi:hypothetical protein
VRYMIQIFNDESDWAKVTDDLIRETAQAHYRFQLEVPELGGKIIGGEALELTNQSVTIQGGTVTDGPFLELRECIGGYYLIDADDLDIAIAIAKRCPASAGVEVRPVQDLSGF